MGNTMVIHLLNPTLCPLACEEPVWLNLGLTSPFLLHATALLNF